MKGYEDFSLLIDKLPSVIFCNDTVYKIDTRTCKALQALYILSMEEVPVTNRLASVRELLITNGKDVAFESLLEVDNELFDYLAGYPSQGAENKQSKPRAILSYEQDHDLLVSSFREAYGFTLEEIRDMHYWLFLAYLRGLPSDTRLGNVIQIRLSEISSKDSPEVKRAKIKAKQAVALKPRKLKGDSEDGFDIISMGLEQGDR